MIYLAYAAAWISTSLGVCAGLYFTHSPWCLWAFLFSSSISLTHKPNGNEDKESGTEEDEHD